MTGATAARHRLLAGACLLLALVVAMVPAADAHDDVTGHAHLFVSLGDDPATSEVEPDDRLTYRFEGTLVAEAFDDGVQIKMALPDGAAVQTFTATNHSDTVMMIDRNSEPEQAALQWFDDPLRPDADRPEPGEPVTGVRLEATRTIDPRASTDIRWGGLDRFNETVVRVEIPTGMTLTSGGDLVRNLHGAPGRAVWSDIDLAKPVLEFSIRPSFSGDDPARSDPPNPAGGWLILLGIALVTGGAWALGKKLENRTKE